MQIVRTFGILFTSLFLLVGLSGCWSARCPRDTCRVRVEHRHGDSFFRPREAFSWMWTPRYKHARVANYAQLMSQGKLEKKAWYRVFKKSTVVSVPKPSKK